MPDLDSVPAAETCGGCAHAVANPQDLTMITCFGAPPVPCVLGGRQVGAQIQYQIECMRPQLARTMRACGAFKPKPALG